MARPNIPNEKKRKRFQATLSSSDMDKLKSIRSVLNLKHMEYLPDSSILVFLINFGYDKLDEIRK